MRATVPALLLGLAVLAGCAAPGPDPAPAPDTAADPAMDMAHAERACLSLPALDAPPQRIVTMDGGTAAFLVRLGVGDRIVGTSAPDFIADFTGAERAQLDAVPVLDPGQGNAEVVIGAAPDLVVGISALSFGGFDGTPTVERLAQAGAAAFAAGSRTVATRMPPPTSCTSPCATAPASSSCASARSASATPQ